MRIDIGQPDPLERSPKNLSHGSGIGPTLAPQSLGTEIAMCIWSHHRFGKQRIIGAEHSFGGQETHPVPDDGHNVVPHRVKESVDGFAEFGFYVSRVLEHMVVLDG